MFVNKHVKNLEPYTLTSHKAWELEDKEGILKLDWNEATIPPSPKVNESIQDFLNKGKLNWYPDVNNKKLLGLLSDYCNLPSKNIQYFASSDALHEYIIKTFSEQGDIITVIAPTYDNFRATAESMGAKINFFKLNDDFEFEKERFRKHIIDYKPKLVYLCNPNNPTGTEYSLEQIRELLTEFNNILFIIDEAYYEFSDNTAAPLIRDFDNFIITRTFSKAFALASFRVGYALSSSKNIEPLNKIRNPKNISTFAQLAAIASLEDKEYVKKYVEEVLSAKEEFKKNLEEIGLKTKLGKGNFILIEIKEDKDSLISYLEKNNMFVRNFSHIRGMGNFIRITIGTKQQMKRVYSVIKGFYNG